jgi:hypothetical protein
MSQMTNDPVPPQGPTHETGDRVRSTAEAAKQEAGSVADTARSQVGDVASAAGEQAKAVVEDAKHQARRVIDQSRHQLKSQASEQTSKLAGSVRDVSRQLHDVTSPGTAPQGLVADLAEQAAGVTSRLADQLENRSPDELLDEAKRFARRRPGLFLLGALGAGFVAGRLVRSVDTQSLVDAAKSGAQPDDRQGIDTPSNRTLAPAAAMSSAAGTGSADLPQGLPSAVRP